jgi:hypothetical protein
MKNLHAIMAMMFATSLDNSPFTIPGDIHTDPVLLKQRKDFNIKQRKKKMGLKEFDFNGTIILALNYKNAEKKYKKLLTK